MPPKNSRNRRDRKSKSNSSQPQQPGTPVVASVPVSPPAAPTVTAPATRGAQRRRAVAASRKPRFGEPIFAWMHHQAVTSPWIGRLFAPESSLWVLFLLVVPVFAVLLDLSTGIRRDGLPFVDVDFFWHLTTGNLILDQHRIPRTDPFSWSYGGRTWIAHEWLAEVMLALAERAGGYAGTILLTTLFAVFGFWRLLAAGRYYGMSRRTAVIVMLLFGGVFIRSGAMVVRPQVFTWALMAVLFAELAAYDTGRRKTLWLIPPLFAIWINMNLTALIGIGCLGAFVIDRLIRKPIDRHVVTVGIASGLALIVNPHHVKLFLLIFKYLNPDSVRRKYVFEWMSPKTADHSHIPFWIAMIFILPALYYLIRRVPHVWPCAPLLVLAYQSNQSIRYIPIYMMLVFVFVGWLIWQRSRERRVVLPTAGAPLFPLKPWIIVPPIVATVLAIWLVTSVDRTQFKRTPTAWGHPVAATEFYLQNYAGLKLFNTYDFGSYMIYRFYGTDNKVYIDGREEMYGEERVRQYFDVIHGQQGWREYLDDQGIQAVVIRDIDTLSDLLDKEPGWTRVFRGSGHLVYVRDELVKPVNN